MLKKVIMPTLGLDMEAATIERWLKREGERVEKDEPLLVVETDKASTEIVAPASGILREIIQPAGASVPVTETIALIETEELRASPAARKAARELGIDLALVKGTGPHGRILGEDVRRFAEAMREGQEGKELQAGAERKEETAAREETAAGGAAFPEGLPGRLEPLGRKRRITAERMALSARTVARLTLHMEIDASELVRMRSRLLPVYETQRGVKLSYNDVLVKAVATALREHPHLNARWTEEGIYLVEPVNVGVAVAVEDGLVVPVVRNADRKKLLEICLELNGLLTKAREGGLTIDDISGGTFTITNLGMFGIDFFTPIVNPPETAILGVGRIVEKPVGRDGQIVLRPVMSLSLSFDHRVVDGAPAARFLQRVQQLLEEPYLLV